MNLSMKQKQTHRRKEQTCVAKGCGGGMDWAFGMSRCKPLYIESINNKVLLYSTGNYIQYLIITYNGKESIMEKNLLLCYNLDRLLSRLAAHLLSWSFPPAPFERCFHLSPVLDSPLPASHVFLLIGLLQ